MTMDHKIHSDHPKECFLVVGISNMICIELFVITSYSRAPSLLMMMTMSMKHWGHPRQPQIYSSKLISNARTHTYREIMHHMVPHFNLTNFGIFFGKTARNHPHRRVWRGRSLASVATVTILHQPNTSAKNSIYYSNLILIFCHESNVKIDGRQTHRQISHRWRAQHTCTMYV